MHCCSAEGYYSPGSLRHNPWSGTDVHNHAPFSAYRSSRIRQGSCLECQVLSVPLHQQPTCHPEKCWFAFFCPLWNCWLRCGLIIAMRTVGEGIGGALGGRGPPRDISRCSDLQSCLIREVLVVQVKAGKDSGPIRSCQVIWVTQQMPKITATAELGWQCFRLLCLGRFSSDRAQKSTWLLRQHSLLQPVL